MVPPPSHKGRLTAEREAEIYTAVLEEMGAHGYERLSMDSVAERAHCSKATLYRQWEGKLGLVVAALSCAAGDACAASIDTGSLRGDLHQWADEFVRDQSQDTALVLGLARSCLAHPDLAAAAHEHAVQTEARRLDEMVDRAITRGEIPADPPGRGHVAMALAGPALLHDILTGVPVSSASLHDFIDAVVLPSLGAPPTTHN